jgi:hypothetical protein
MTAEPPKRIYANSFSGGRAFVGKCLTMALKFKYLTYLLILPLLLQGFFGFSSQPIIPVTSGSTDTSIVQSQVSLKDFSTALKTDTGTDLQGIFASGVLALRVVQQPSGKPGYVSSVDGVVTQFSMAKPYNVIGLLAHNFSSGSEFFNLKLGDKISLIYGDGTIKEMQITKVDKYQALSPTSPYSDFQNLVTGERLTAEQVFYKYYTGNPHLTLQTCIAQGDQGSWGRIFIVAQVIP